jgi:hypothetical protein
LVKIENGGYNFLQLQRTLPFAVLNVAGRILGGVGELETLLWGMVMFHGLVLCLAVYWYFSLAQRLNLSENQTILGFLLLFCNFSLLKDMWYNPFHPGFMALMLGIGQVFYFVRAEKERLLFVSLVAGFVWPSMYVTGLVLMLFPRDKAVIHLQERPKSLYPMIVTGLFLLVIIVSGIWTGKFANGGKETVLYVLSVAALLVYFLVFLVKNPVKWKQSFELLRTKTAPGNRAFLGLGLFAFFLVVFLLSGGNAEISILALAGNYFGAILRFPLDFLVGHTLYFGFLVPLAMVFFPRIMKEMANLGLGFTTVCVFMFVFVLHPEPQFLMPFFPFLVLLVLKAIKRYRILTKDILVIGVVNILVSGVWLPLNVSGMEKALGASDASLLLQFPAQRYWMHFGNGMSLQVYLGATAIFAFLVWLAWSGKTRYKRLSKISEFALASKGQASNR